MNSPKLLKAGFSTADAEYPEIHQIDGDLFVRYQDWQEKAVEIFFSDPIAFKWQMADFFYDGERDDCCYEILDSTWIEEHIKSEDISVSEGFHHYKLNFNGIGQLEVLANSFNVKT